MAAVLARISRAADEGYAPEVSGRDRICAEFRRRVAAGTLQEDLPTSVILTDRLVANAQRFIGTFPQGTKHMYATKANPSLDVMKTLFQAGITHFDVASGEEIRNTRALLGSEAVLYYMNPIKSKTDLRTAFACDVKGFVADYPDDLERILTYRDEEGRSFDPKHHAVVIRLATKSEGAQIDLSGKFGATSEMAIALLQRCAGAGVTDIGMSFHVGSENHDPSSYAHAIDAVGACARQAGITLSTVDVGGGFPSFTPYAHMEKPAPDFAFYIQQIKTALERNRLTQAQLLTEPGRALVADAGILITRVRRVDEGRQAVYLNTGTFGGLYDTRMEIGFDFPTFAFNAHGLMGGPTRPMTVYGPTCDSADKVHRKWGMPCDLATDDYVAVEVTGAYGQEAMGSDFNGFGQFQTFKIGGRF